MTIAAFKEMIQPLLRDNGVDLPVDRCVSKNDVM
jgi:hypothetical protein